MTEKEFREKIDKIDPKKWVLIMKDCFPKWKKLFNETDELYYYTNLNALIDGILKYDDNICLWASRWSHLNDPQEIIMGTKEFDVFEKVGWVKDSISEIVRDIHSVSFSEYGDFLPMWKMYGDGGNGVMLVFETKEIIKKWGGLLQPCMYKDTKAYNKSIDAIIDLPTHPEMLALDTDQQQYVIIMMLKMFISITKKYDYLYEKEVRLSGLHYGCMGNECEQQYRVSGNTIIPYVEALLPKESLKGVCLGPLVNSQLNENTLKEFLCNKGYDNVDVVKSEISYR